jgi:hypothetical protein
MAFVSLILDKLRADLHAEEWSETFVVVIIFDRYLHHHMSRHEFGEVG